MLFRSSVFCRRTRQRTNHDQRKSSASEPVFGLFHAQPNCGIGAAQEGSHHRHVCYETIGYSGSRRLFAGIEVALRFLSRFFNRIPPRYLLPPRAPEHVEINARSYMASGLRNWGEQKAVVEHILDLLHTPEYRDVLPQFRESGVLAFTPRVTFTVLADRKYWSFLNLALLKRAIPSDIFWTLPHWLQRIIRKLRGILG